MHQKTIKESQIAHAKVGGHSHDGEDSTKLDFSKYTPTELRALSDALKDSGAQDATSEANDSASDAGIQINETFVEDSMNPVTNPITTTAIHFDVYERVYIDLSWDVPWKYEPQENNYFQQYYWDSYYPSFTGGEVYEYEVSLVKVAEPGDSDIRYRTKNTQIRITDVDPDTEYRYYIWAINSLNIESLYETGTITSSSIYNVVSSGKRNDLLPNGTFEDDVSGWTGTNGCILTQSPTEKYSGSNSMNADADAGVTEIHSDLLPGIYGDAFYDISCWVGHAGSFWPTATLKVEWFDSDQVTIQTDTIDSVVPSNSTWIQLKSDYFTQAPTNAAYFIVKLEDTTGAGDDLYIDDWRFETSSYSEGFGFATDSADQRPQIFIKGHNEIGLPLDINKTDDYAYIKTYDSQAPNTELSSAVDRQAVVEISSGEADSDSDPSSAKLRVISRHELDDGGGPDTTASGVADLELTIDDTSASTYSLPRGLMGIDEQSSDITSIGATFVSCGLITNMLLLKHRVYRISLNYNYCSATANGFWRFHLFHDAVVMGHTSLEIGSVVSLPAPVQFIYTPTVDLSATLELKSQRASGTGTMSIIKGSNPNINFLVEDIGMLHAKNLGARTP